MDENTHATRGRMLLTPSTKRLRRPVLRVGAALTAMLLVASCGGIDTPEATSSSSAGDAAGTRYAVQWRAYQGEQVGVPINAHLSFIDAFGPGGHRHEPVFDQVVLLGEGQPVAVTVLDIATGFENEEFRAIDLSLSIEELPQGVHDFDRVRYHDEHGVERETAIGQYRIEIIERQPADLSIWRAEVGATLFTNLGVQLQNDLDVPVNVIGLRCELPGLPIATQMHIVSAVEPIESANEGEGGEPLPAPTAAAVANAEFQAGERLELRFDFSGADERSFVVLQPLLRYTRSDGSEGLLPLAAQRYAPGFEAPEQLLQYLETIPAAGRHALN